MIANSNGVQDDKKSRRFLSPEKKFQIFLEAQRGDVLAAEVLRREGLYSTDLARIRQKVKEGALERLSATWGQKEDGLFGTIRGLKTGTGGKGAGVGGDGSGGGHLKKKNEWGFLGKIEGCWLESDRKREIVSSTVQGKEEGTPVSRTCRMWAIQRRRVTRWRGRLTQGLPLENGKPGPK